MRRVHGADGWPAPAFDFSSNAVAVSPLSAVLRALRECDPARYPEGSYASVREHLALLHGTSSRRVLAAGSASEFIQRITAVSGRVHPGAVAVPKPAYGDYELAAHAWGRPVVSWAEPAATLRWCCDPSSPFGRHSPPPPWHKVRPDCITVLDAVYAPLRLQGKSPWTEVDRAKVFELHSPNKALGLTGIRAAYAIAPVDADPALIDALETAAPSWPIGSHGVAMLQAWVRPDVQQWVADQREVLRAWKSSQVAALERLSAVVEPGDTNFFVCTLPSGATAQALRQRGVAVRDTASFGLAGRVRLSVQPPDTVQALCDAIEQACEEHARGCSMPDAGGM